MKRIFVVMLTCLSLMSFVSAMDSLDAEKYFLYNGFRTYDDQSTNKVSYSIKVENEVEYKFELKYYYEGKFIEVCSKDIFLELDEGFTKVTCEIQKLGNGEYIFDANLYSVEDSSVVDNVYSREYIYGSSKVDIDFEDRGDETVVIINVEGDLENVDVKCRIPKSVIELLNDENKDSLIESDLEYVILEEDPLIAWHVDRIPATVNYTVKKKISDEQKKEFQVEMTQTKGFQLLKYFMFVLILLIVILLIKPLLRKNGAKK